MAKIADYVQAVTENQPLLKKILELDKASAISWFSLNNLPQPLLEGSASLIKAYKSRQIYH